MEQEVFTHANAISIVGPTWKKDLESIGAKDVQVLPWGYDGDDFENLEPIQIQGFSITHTGILGTDRNPTELWQAIEILAQKTPSFLHDLRLQLVGLVDAGIKEETRQRGLQNNLSFPGTVNRNTALAYTIGSSVLLLVLNRQDNAEGRIPGKFFEYLASGRPILAIGPKKSDVQKMMEESSAGRYCPFDDVPACLNALEDFYQQYLSGNLNGAGRDKILSFSNLHITGKVAEILNSFEK
jgi:glycosyltransferase involved in cell wall biosynthesis